MYCPQCGSEVENSAVVCPVCKAEISAPAASYTANSAPGFGAQSEKANDAQDTIAEKLGKLNDTEDTTAEYDPADIEANKILALFSYVSILVLIPIFAAKDSKFARFHINQGIVLLVAEIIASVLGGVLSAIPLLPFVFWLCDLAFAIASVIGIINAINGKAKELPVIGKFKVFK